MCNDKEHLTVMKKIYTADCIDQGCFGQLFFDDASIKKPPREFWKNIDQYISDEFIMNYIDCIKIPKDCLFID